MMHAYMHKHHKIIVVLGSDSESYLFVEKKEMVWVSQKEELKKRAINDLLWQYLIAWKTGM